MDKFKIIQKHASSIIIILISYKFYFTRVSLKF